MSKHRLIDRQGAPLILGNELGKGGEGSVFEVQGNPSIVAKIYHKIPSQEKSCKIIAMVNLSNEKIRKLATWPLDSIHDKSHELVGFTMEKLQGYRPLYDLYIPKLRLKEFPDADWRFLIHTAMNTARAFAVIHESGHVVGDVNHGNLLVCNKGTVKFIDTDSFQVILNGKSWLCEVGVATHQPPEMQGHASYKEIIRNPNHDNFGLAILIFQLLCLARHPFSGKFLGSSYMPIEKAITECRFAYSKNNRHTQMLPPPASLQMNALTPRIGSFFEKAFSREGISGLRPTAKEWISALEELLSSLKLCQVNKAHYYINPLAECPWCNIEAKSNLALFPVILPALNAIHNIASLWQQVLNVNEPQIMQDLSNITIVRKSPSNEATKIKGKIKRLRIYLIMAIGCLAPLLFIVDNKLQAFTLSIIILYFQCVYYNSKSQKLKENILKQWETEKEKWNRLYSDWNDLSNATSFKQIRQSLNALKQKHDDLGKERFYKIQKLFGTKQQQQLIKHLDRYHIEKANLEGIGTERRATLRSYGIETAADIDMHQLSGISGFGPKLIQRLMNWRAMCESKFVFVPSHEISASDVAIIDRDIGLKMRKIEDEIARGYAQLIQVKDQLLIRQQQIQSQASNIANLYAQARADAYEVGIKV